MIKLEIYGDSILKGVTYSGENNKYSICREGRPTGLAEMGIQVTNRSQMGATVEDGLRRAMKNAENWDEDTLVLFEYGGNDCEYDWKTISEDPGQAVFPKTEAEIFMNTYRKLISLAKEKGARVAVSTLVPLDSQKYFDWITRGLSRENILGWLGDREMLYRWHEYYNELVRSVAEDFGCMILDLRRHFLNLRNFKTLLCEDGIHPSKEGHILIRDVLTEDIGALASA